MGYLALVYIHYIADILEGEEGDADRKQDNRGVEVIGAEGTVGP